eukprot:CAMPEP_0170491642 /NCGR_PEP_ID=MMETSP0208-20121228/11171_1 /TAXON_ID=197538 /ORGANISM="Strombidium inclinatum, Strain S3" /LENGTH=229 /DNA_ID=CAMNT_0010767249 /DNA_START=14 /DNA_END=703 /DNA_ORIENTATION=+
MENYDLIDKFEGILAENIDEWEQVHQTVRGQESFTLWRKDKTVDGTPLGPRETYFRVKCTFANVEPEVAFSCFSQSDKRKNWDTRMRDYVTLEDRGVDLIKYFIVKSNVMLVQDRDVLIRQQVRENYPEPGQFILANVSTEHDTQPVVPAYIRSTIKIQGYKFVPAPDVKGVTIEWVQDLDVHGAMPACIFRGASVRMHTKLNDILKRTLDEEQESVSSGRNSAGVNDA